MIKYRVLEMENYPRAEHFRYFSAMPNPSAGVTAKVDVTRLVRFCKEKGCSFYTAMVHIACLAANRIPEFRRRTRDGGIIEYETCGTSHIELMPNETYCYCSLRHEMDWDEYLPYAGRCREEARSAPCITGDEDADAQYFITTLPWVHYEQILMPVTAPVADNPRFCWGKYEEDFRGLLMMPFTVIVNHALMDGIHISALFRNLQQEIDRLEI